MKKINIVIPMAGRGSRFEEAGYKKYKPLLPVAGRTMIEAVVDNVRPTSPKSEVILIAREENQREVWKLFGKDKRVIVCKVPEVTEGAACTVLTVDTLINNDTPLIIANSDQYIDWSVDVFLERMAEGKYDAGILTLPTDDPKYSFAQVVEDYDSRAREVVRTAEKRPISRYGTVGVYWFRNGSDFVKAAQRMIEDEDRFNGEFYVCPVFNYLPRTKKIGFYHIPADAAHFLGDPAGYEDYIAKVGK